MGTDAATSESCDWAAAIIDSLDGPAFVIDRSGNLIHLNGAAAEILAIDRDRVISRQFDDVEHHCASWTLVRSALESTGSSPSGEQQVELSITMPGRAQRHLLKVALLRKRDGNSLGTLVLFHDVSLRREVGPHDTAVAAVAQQLNTPLTSLSLAAELLQRGREEQNELIREIIEDVDRLNHASADFLNVVHERPGSIALQNTDFDLMTVFDFV